MHSAGSKQAILFAALTYSAWSVLTIVYQFRNPLCIAFSYVASCGGKGASILPAFPELGMAFCCYFRFHSYLLNLSICRSPISILFASRLSARAPVASEDKVAPQMSILRKILSSDQLKSNHQEEPPLHSQCNSVSSICNPPYYYYQFLPV